MPLSITATPALPSEFRSLADAAISAGLDGNWCSVLLSFRKFQILQWRVYKYWFSDDEGTPTSTYAEELCDALDRCEELADPDSDLFKNEDLENMPTFPSPEELRDLIPSAGAPLCEQFIPGIANWMKRWADAYENIYKENGEFTSAFVAKLCALDCLTSGGGGGGGGGTTCPEVILSGVVTAKNASLELEFNGESMLAGYSYTLYRKAAPADPWVSISTGTTTGSVVDYVDTGLVNGTTYYYKLEVQKPTCSIYSVEVSGAPSECQVYDLGLSLSSVAPASITAQITGEGIESTFLVTIWISEYQGSIGSEAANGTVADYSCTINGRQAICYTHATDLDPSKVYYVTAHVKQTASCAAFQMTGSIRPMSYPVTSPALGLSGGTLVWGAVPGATGYIVYNRAIGNCLSYDYRVLGTRPANFTSLGIPSLPCTNQISGEGTNCPGCLPGVPRCNGHYEFYVVAVGASGNQSPPSNVVTYSFQRSQTCL